MDAPIGFETLADLDLVRRFATACHRLTGRCIYLVDVDPSRYRAFHDRDRMSPFCALVQGTAKGRALCKASDLALRGACAQSRKPCSRTCWAGLTDVVVPVEVGGKLLGFLAAGQVHAREPGARGLKRMLRLASGLRPASELEKAWKKTPIMSAKKTGELLSLFQIFVEQLSELESKLALGGRSSEHEALGRAKSYLALHWREAVRLRDVALHANVSLEHLCRLFKRETGRTMTDLLNGIRIEEAMKLLRHGERRMAQVARRTGFRSLSQFDRVFRRITGGSPRRWLSEIDG